MIADALVGFGSSVQLLNFADTNMTAQGFRALITTLRSNHDLHTLILDNNDLGTPYSFQAISGLIASTAKFKVLSCANCRLSDTFGVPFAEALKTNRGLERFNFYGNELTSRTLRHLAQAFKELAGSLKSFNLGKNGLGDEGGVKLGDSLKWLSTLESVNLSDNEFKDETGEAICRSLME